MKKQINITINNFISSLILILITLFLIFCIKTVYGWIFPAETIQLTELTEYSVQAGDTLWSIARKYKPADMDIREYIYYLKEYNDCTDCVIKPNDIIKILG